VVEKSHRRYTRYNTTALTPDDKYNLILYRSIEYVRTCPPTTFVYFKYCINLPIYISYPNGVLFTVSTENIAKAPWTCTNCLNRSKADSQETLAVEDSPPQCPHNGAHGSATRSPSPVSTCPTPKPFLIFTDSAHGWVLYAIPMGYNTTISGPE